MSEEKLPAERGPEPLSARLQRLMAQRGMQQRQLARRARLSEASISRLLTGEQANPTTRTLQALAEALGVDLRDLLLEGEPPPTPAAESEAVLLALYRLLSPEERGRIVGYAEAIAEQRRLREGGSQEGSAQFQAKGLLASQ